MHFYCLANYSGSCCLSSITKQDWYNGKIKTTTVLYEPGEEADEFIGTCLMLGIPVTFIKIDTSVEVPEGKGVYILSTYEPMVTTTLTGRLITLYLSSDESIQ